MKIYTAIEAAAKTSISKRTIQYKCKRDNIRKKLNVYQITDEELKKWIEEDVNSPRNSRAIAQDVAHVPNEQQEYEKAFYLAAIDKYEEEAAEALSFREWSKETIKDLKIKASLKATKHKERCEELEEAVRGYISYIEKYEEEIKRLEKEVKEWEEYKLEDYLKDLKGEAALTTGKQARRIKDLEEELKMNVAILEKYEIELEELDIAKVEIIRLEKEVKEWEEYKLEDYLPEIEDIPLEQLEAFEFQFKRSGENEAKKGKLLFIQKGMVADEYTPEEYNNMKLNMENYQLMELKLDHKDELHAVEIKRIEQSKENKSKLHSKEVEKLIVERDYYKNSYYYVRRQNKDFLSLVMLSGKESMIKTVKDAKNTEWKK